MRKVSNPLTIIGIFAGVTETAGAVALPFLDGAVHAWYVGFLILFPVLLVVLFFTTLFVRPAALFSPDEHGGPSDYRRSVLDNRNRQAFLARVLDEPDLVDRLKIATTRSEASFERWEEVFDDD